MRIEEIMTKEVLAVRESTSVERMAKLFAKHKISGAPVIDDSGELTGVVSLSDLSRKESAAPAEHHEFYLNPSWNIVTTNTSVDAKKTVKNIMTNLVIFVEAEEDIERAADLMVNHGIHRVVVTRNGKVVGIVTSADMVREFRARLKAAKQLR